MYLYKDRKIAYADSILLAVFSYLSKLCNFTPSIFSYFIVVFGYNIIKMAIELEFLRENNKNF